MKSGRCPKCGSSRVYTWREGGWLRVTHPLYLAGKKLLPGIYNSARVDRDFYICLECGYLETYAIVDRNVAKMVEEGWTQVGS